MSWLGSFGVLPSPNHVLAKLAIFRGAEHSPHSPRTTDSAAVFYYYFKPFAAPLARPLPRRRPLSPSEHPSRSPVSSPQFSLPPPPDSPHDPASFSRRHLSSGRTANHPLPLRPVLSRRRHPVVPSGGDENFQTPRDRNRIVISRGSRPSAIHRANSLFLHRPWAYVVPMPKVLEAFALLLCPSRRRFSFLHIRNTWYVRQLPSFVRCGETKKGMKL